MGTILLKDVSPLPQKSKANVIEVFSYSIILSCIVDKIWLSDTNLLKLKCKVIYLLMDVDLYFLQIIEEGLCTFLIAEKFVACNKCDRRWLFISRLCSWSFLGIIVGCETFAQKIWLSTLQAITDFFFGNKQKKMGRLFPRVAPSNGVSFFLTVHTIFV